MIRLFWRRCSSAYETLLERHPLFTEMVTSAALWFAGDLTAQRFELKMAADAAGSDGGDGATASWFVLSDKVDWSRTFVQASYASVIWAPFGHYWYQVLDSAARSITKAGTAKFVAAKLVLEAIVLHPVSLLLFFSCVGAMNGESWEDLTEQLQRDFVPTLVAELALWTPLDVANFAVTPVRHQLLVVNLGCLAESVGLSYIKANGFSLGWFGASH